MCGIEGSVLSEMFSDEFIHEIPRYLAAFSTAIRRLFVGQRWFGVTLSRWWFQKFLFSSLFGEDSHFD